MFFIYLLKVIGSVCCFSLHMGNLYFLTSDGVLVLGSSKLSLPGEPVCFSYPFAVSSEDGRVFVYLIVRNSILTELTKIWFKPSRCYAYDHELAVSAPSSNFSAILDFKNNVTYIIPRSSLVKIFDGEIIIIKGNVVEVHSAGGGFTVRLNGVVNDAYAAQGRLYACTSEGIYEILGKEVVRRLSDVPCQHVALSPFGTLASSFLTRVRLYKVNEDKITELRSLAFPYVVKALAIGRDALYVQSGSELFVYSFAEVSDDTLTLILGVPTLLAALNALKKVISRH